MISPSLFDGCRCHVVGGSGPLRHLYGYNLHSTDDGSPAALGQVKGKLGLRFLGSTLNLSPASKSTQQRNSPSTFCRGCSHQCWHRPIQLIDKTQRSCFSVPQQQRAGGKPWRTGKASANRRFPTFGVIVPRIRWARLSRAPRGCSQAGPHRGHALPCQQSTAVRRWRT